MPGTGLGVGDTAVNKRLHTVTLEVLCQADRHIGMGSLQIWWVGGSGPGSQPGWGSGRALEQVVGRLEGEPGGHDQAALRVIHACLPGT